uniref:Uncharacterized protein n=1 Tax=Tanacetum cinerariifolium TaxID=118510 RepID=A0A6L2KFB3_TANCI|nr:hypothetical protein [Tanacetum cinerariifolium]
MILESVENGPLIWPTIEKNGVSRPRKYSELTHADAIQADCDVKETNIILQGLPPEANWCCMFVGISEDGDGEWCMMEMDECSGRKRCSEKGQETLCCARCFEP